MSTPYRPQPRAHFRRPDRFWVKSLNVASQFLRSFNATSGSQRSSPATTCHNHRDAFPASSTPMKARRQSEHTVDGKRVKVWSTESVPLQLTERCCRRRRRRRKSTGGGSRRCGAQQRRPWIAYPSSSVRKGDSRYTSDREKATVCKFQNTQRGHFSRNAGIGWLLLSATFYTVCNSRTLRRCYPPCFLPWPLHAQQGARFSPELPSPTHLNSSSNSDSNFAVSLCFMCK